MSAFAAPLLSVLIAAAAGGPPISSEAEPVADPPEAATAEKPDAASPQLTRMPVLVGYVEAAYPADALAQRIEGEVVLRLVIDEKGTVTDAQVLQPAGRGFDESAVAAARQFRFEPALMGEAPVPVMIEYRTRFQLESEPAAQVPNFVGQVLAAEDGKPISGASVYLPELDLGAQTGPDGSFSFTAVPAGAHALSVFAFARERLNTSVVIDPKSAVSATYRLSGERRSHYETKVIARRVREEVRRRPVELNVRPVVSEYQLTRRDVELTPGALEDISRVVQTLPGVVGDPGLMATFFVRGGDSDEAVFYLDGVPLANPYHLGGFATLFNPELIREVSFFAGGQPARYRSSLSGALDVGYLAGQAERFEGVVDLSANTAKLMVAGPTPVEGLSVMLSARRSYFELYFMLLKDLGIVGQRFVAPDIGEYEAKATWRGGKHRVDVAFLQATDGLSFTSDPDEEALFSFEGGLRTQNSLSLGSLSWRWDASQRLKLSSVLALIRDRQETERTGAGASQTSSLVSSSDSRLTDVVWRVDAELNTHAENRLRFGLDLDWWDQAFFGRVEDTRATPPWLMTPMANYHRDALDIEPALRRLTAGVYLDDEWKDLLPGLTPRVGVRLDVAQGMAKPMVSPRAALSWRVFEPTVLKAAWGVYHQVPRNPLELDPTYGNPDLGPERATHYIVGLEQMLPLRTLLRVEGYYKDLRDLVVNPDDPAAVAAGTTFTNDGTGWAYGADALLLHRGERFGFGLSYGYLQTERTNPLNTRYAKTYAPHQLQEHTFAASADYSIADTWVFAARYQFHVGRPYSTLGSFSLEERDGEQVYVPVLGAGDRLNDGRLGSFHEASVRAERWFRFNAWRMVVYAELLNVTNHSSVYVYMYDEGDPATGTLPKRGAFNHLPIRPFLGLRGEY